MTVRELKDLLDDYDDDLEVRLVHQPSYPLESEVAGVASRSECDEERTCRACEDDCKCTHDNGPDVVYIAEGRQLGYGDGKVWQAIG